jgi:hypothetical protein
MGITCWVSYLRMNLKLQTPSSDKRGCRTVIDYVKINEKLAPLVEDNKYI